VWARESRTRVVGRDFDVSPSGSSDTKLKTKMLGSSALRGQGPSEGKHTPQRSDEPRRLFKKTACKIHIFACGIFLS
jgi:hypothetical protein